MIASNNPIDLELAINIVRIPSTVDIVNRFPVLLNSVGVNNVTTAKVELNLSTTRVFVTFAASILSGTASVTQGSDIITGTGTDFINELVIGDVVTINDEPHEIVEIISATSARLDIPFIGASANNALIIKSPRPTQTISLTVLIDSVDVSANLTGTLAVDWPDDSGGTCRFTLAGQNPFLSSPAVNVDKEVEVKATFTDSSNNAFTVKMFTGKIVQYDYNPDTDIADVQVQDSSWDLSHETDKLNQEIQNVDPVFTETITAPANDKLIVSKTIDAGTDNPIFGVWNESDTLRDDNIAEEFDFTLDNKTVTILQTGKIISGRNYVIRYAIPRSSFTRIIRKKSELIEDIVQLAGLESLINERKDQIEDEVVNVNVVANQEFPLDLMRKIVLPQTWKIEFTEGGDLLIRRERLKSTPDLVFNEQSILVDTLFITKSIDTVINEQRVSGIIKRLGEEA